MKPPDLATALATSLLVLTLTGCAGGWKNGPPPGAEDAAVTAVPSRGESTHSPPTEVTFIWKGAAQTVHLAGEFNDWSTSAEPLSQREDGSWAIVRHLEPGRYSYKFVIDGSTWKEDPTATEFVDDGFGGKNSVVVVTLGAGDRTRRASQPSPATPGALGQAPIVTPQGVSFTFAGQARAVYLAGSFNDWSTTANPMMKGADGRWTLTLKLAPGKHEYKFLVDGSAWKQDEANPETNDDGFGGKNSVVVVE